MGMDFSAGKIYNVCPHCNRFERDEKLSFGKAIFKETPDKAETLEDGRTAYVYKGAPDLFYQHIENLEIYHGEEALEKWKDVQDCIDPHYYTKILRVLKDGDGYFEAWW